LVTANLIYLAKSLRVSLRETLCALCVEKHPVFLAENAEIKR
jgi:hypothetical protein